MLNMAQKRICPSRNWSICVNMRRQPAGDTKGKIPSITSTRPRATQKLLAHSMGTPRFARGGLLALRSRRSAPARAAEGLEEVGG